MTPEQLTKFKNTKSPDDIKKYKEFCLDRVDWCNSTINRLTKKLSKTRVEDNRVKLIESINEFMEWLLEYQQQILLLEEVK